MTMIPVGTIWQDNARRFARTREDVEREQAAIRARYHEQAIAALRDGRPGRAYYLVMRGFHEQVRVAGLGYSALSGMPYEAGGPLPAEPRGRHRLHLGDVEISRGVPVDELLTCVACGVLICRPCLVDLPNGEVECPQCARADVRGREVSRG